MIKKIRAKFDRKEGALAYFKSGSTEFSLPSDASSGLSSGEGAVILVADEATDVENSTAVARALLTEVFRDDEKNSTK